MNTAVCAMNRAAGRSLSLPTAANGGLASRQSTSRGTRLARSRHSFNGELLLL